MRKSIIVVIIALFALQSSADFASDCVTAHNSYRTPLNIASITWSDDIARSAQAWADKLAAMGDLEHSSSKYGENLASRTGHYTPESSSNSGTTTSQGDNSQDGNNASSSQNNNNNQGSNSNSASSTQNTNSNSNSNNNSNKQGSSSNSASSTRNTNKSSNSNNNSNNQGSTSSNSQNNNNNGFSWNSGSSSSQSNQNYQDSQQSSRHSRHHRHHRHGRHHSNRYQDDSSDDNSSDYDNDGSNERYNDGGNGDNYLRRDDRNLARSRSSSNSESSSSNSGSGTALVNKLIGQWGAEKQYFHYGTYPDVSSGGTVGHYTQMVWGETRQVGCGISNNNDGWVYLVCQYYPAGNMRGDPVY